MPRAEIHIPKDDQTMRLAHPQRCAACLSPEEQSVWSKILAPGTWQALQAGFKAPGGFTADILAHLVDQPEHATLGFLTEALSKGDSGTEMGTAFALMLYLRQSMAPQPQFLIDDALVAMLEQTDISEDVPVSVLRLPFPRCYLELGRSRSTDIIVPNLVSGAHVLEGAYLEFAESPRKGPGLYVMLTGSPLGHENAMDDATSSLFIPTGDPTQPLRSALASARAQSGELARSLGLRETPQEFFEHEIQALMLIAKALLYIGLPQARRTLKNDHSQALTSALSKKNPAKRERALADARRLADYVLITAPPESKVPGMETGRALKAHWRRGHYRMQRHGPALALQKLIFIEPTLVGSMEPDPVTQYRVTA